MRYSCLYLAHCNVLSATHVMLGAELGTQPIDQERRAFRGQGIISHWASVESLVDFYGGFEPWLCGEMVGEPFQDWTAVVRRAAMAWGNKRWSAYKLAEVLQQVHGYPIAAPHMAHRDTSHGGPTAPRKGLGMFYSLPGGNVQSDIRRIDRLTGVWMGELAKRGTKLTIEEAETVLCNFHSLAQGRYYIGRDIDMIGGQIAKATGPGVELLWQARRETLPQRYLGELGGWEGVQRDRLHAYRDRGEILVR